MGADLGNSLDAKDWAVIAELQRDGRLPVAELGRRVGLGEADVTERVRRLELAGVITGVHARIDPARLGLPLLAIVRVENPTHRHQQIHRLIAERREIVECLWVAAESSYLVRVVASSTHHLEQLAGALSQLGPTTTSVVSATPLHRRGVDRPMQRHLG
jgi:Lrp/AsnC family leucine-responsive transcriptional regulator